MNSRSCICRRADVSPAEWPNTGSSTATRYRLTITTTRPKRERSKTLLYEGRKMSITLIVTQGYDVDFNQTGQEIDEEEWEEFVVSQDNLRFNSEPMVCKNPATGETIEMAAPEGATEVNVNGSWYPFLSFSNGELRMQYLPDFENPDNSVRKAITGVAGYFAALITTDAGDEILAW